MAGQPPLACDKGCPACCALRVTATAPEIFLIADYIRKVAVTPQGARLDLPGRVARAEAATAGLDEGDRLAQATACPLLVGEQCILHPVRTLACRGHAAFQRSQCVAAANGEDVEIAISQVHLTLRGLVQNALQSALRDAGLAWGLYELNRGLNLALDDARLAEAWLDGADPLAPAIPDLDMDALGAAFDRLHALN
jgi:Fe-S-cluster containining protein